MQAWHYRVTSAVVLAVALAASGACSSNTEQGREEAAATEFRQRLAQNRVEQIFSSSEFLRNKYTADDFRRTAAQVQVLGILQQTERAHYKRTQIPGEPDLIVAF